MKKVVFNITIQTTHPFGERGILSAILDRISSVPRLKPRSFGFSEPLKQQWGANSLEDLAPLHQPKGEICFFRLAPPMRGLLTINTTRNPRAACNEIKLVTDYAGVHDRLDEFERLLHDLAIMVDADFAAATISGGDPFSVNVQNPKENFGEIEGRSIPPASPTGIRFLNGIWWINIFGRRYLEFFGERTFENLPTHRAERIAPGLLWLQPTKTPLDMLEPPGVALGEAIKSRLDRPRAFYGYESGKPGIMLSYDTPAFDFSLIRPKAK
jgi:hypothetical protein